MRTLRAALAAALSASLCVPASAQVRAAAAVAGSAAPRALPVVPVLSASWASAPSVLASPLGAPSAFAAPAAAPSAAPAVAASPAAAAAPAAAVVLAAPAAAPAVAALEGVRPEAARSEATAAPVAAESERASWDAFWSGSSARAEDVSAPVAAEAPSRASSSPRVRLAAAVAAPAAHGAAALWTHVAPYAEAGAVLAGAWAATRLVQKLVSWFAAKRGLDRQKVAVIRLATSVVVWTAATAAALHFGGAPGELTATVLGAGGTILTLGLRDVLGNLIQGVYFLVTRPFTVGERVRIGDNEGVVSDLTLGGVVVTKDDGAEVKVRHSALAAMTVVIVGEYRVPDGGLHLKRFHAPARPRFDGVAGAVWSSLSRGFWLSAAALAALLLAPHFVAAAGVGVVGTVVHYATAGALAWATSRVAAALSAAVDKLAERNGWRVETRVVARLIASALVWAIGGGAALRAVGVSWTALGASVGVTTLGIGLASNNFFGSVVQGASVLFSKPFAIGDRLKVGASDGVVEDMTLYHVVIKLDEGRHALVPYAVVRDSALVVTHAKENTK